MKNKSVHWWHQRFSQQARWTAELRRYLFEHAGIESACRVLEVGCGSGVVLGEMELENAGIIHGLDLSANFLHLARDYQTLAHLVQGDAHRLPYAASSFEIVCCHFLLLWVVDPQSVVDEMVRVTRPGGAVLLLAEPDYGGRIDYPDEFSTLGRMQEEALRRQGAETRLGRRLGALLNRSGLEKVETGVLGGQWQAAPDPSELESEWAVMQSDLTGILSQAELARLRRMDEAAWQRGERTLFVPTFYGWGRKIHPQ